MAPYHHQTMERWLRQELVAHRESRGLRRDDAAKLLEVSERTLTRLEKGPTPVTSTHLLMASHHYELCREEHDRLKRMREVAYSDGWWSEFEDLGISSTYMEHCELEDVSDSIISCTGMFVLGALQTPAYARLIDNRLGHDIDEPRATRSAQLRAARGHRLALPGGPRIRYLVGEAALRRQLPAEVMADQLDHLRKVNSDENNFVIQVLPDHSTYVMPDSFEVFTVAVAQRQVLCTNGFIYDTHVTLPSLIESHAKAFDMWWQHSIPLEEFRMVP